MTLAGIAGGCGSPSADDPAEAWTDRPAITAARDGGVVDGASNDAAEAAIPDDPPETLCTLSGPPASTPGDTLVWGEELGGAAVDTTKWTVSAGKRGPSDVISATSPSEVAVHDGSVFISAARAPAGAAYPYVAGSLDTLGKFARTYGRVEFRARFPYAAGVWYALWGRAWFDSFPEIDIEILNTAANTHSQLYFVNHWAAPPIPADDRRKYVKLDDIDLNAFHTFTISWTPGLIEWAIDGVPKMQSNGAGVPTKPVYWMMNSWVGGWGGTPPASTVFPVTFEVDYLRVYRVDGLIGDPLIHVVNTATTFARTDIITVAAANFDEACAHVEMYDGDALVRTTSKAPYHFSLGRLASGTHALTFKATDGVRNITTTLTAVIK